MTVLGQFPARGHWITRYGLSDPQKLAWNAANGAQIAQTCESEPEHRYKNGEYYANGTWNSVSPWHCLSLMCKRPRRVAKGAAQPF